MFLMQVLFANFLTLSSWILLLILSQALRFIDLFIEIYPFLNSQAGFVLFIHAFWASTLFQLQLCPNVMAHLCSGYRKPLPWAWMIHSCSYWLQVIDIFVHAEHTSWISTILWLLLLITWEGWFKKKVLTPFRKTLKPIEVMGKQGEKARCVHTISMCVCYCMGSVWIGKYRHPDICRSCICNFNYPWFKNPPIIQMTVIAVSYHCLVDSSLFASTNRKCSQEVSWSADNNMKSDRWHVIFSTPPHFQVGGNVSC